MQSFSPGDRDVREGDEGVAPDRVPGLRERLTEHLRMSLLPERDIAGHLAGAGRMPLIRWIGAPRQHRAPGTKGSTVIHRLHRLLESRRYEACRDELSRAELAEEISEFCALNFHAILAVVERSGLANDYLLMAEAVAASAYERAIVAENRAAYDLVNGDSFAAAERCVAALEHVCQTEGLWIILLIALCHLGELETIDATLRSLTKLHDECTTRLVRSLSSEPDLRDVHARPAFQRLVDSRRSGSSTISCGEV
jgi:hypothetical protein